MSENEGTSIGKTLRDARIAKGFTLDDLQQTTKIQKRYLIAIEDERFEDLPGDFYVRAFIKQYADTVDLDGSELLNEFSNKLPNTKTQEYVDKVNEDNPTTRSTQRKAEDRYENIRRRIPVIAAIIVVILVLGGIWYASSLHSERSTQDNIDSSSVSVSGSSSEKSSSKAKESSSESKEPKVSFETTSNSGTAATLEMKNAPKNKAVKITTTGNAWTSVATTSATLWSGTLASSSETVKVPSATTQLSITLGSVDNTAITIGGHKVPLTKLTAASSSSSTSATTTSSSSQYGASNTYSSSSTSAKLSSLTIVFK
ncbi:XRE family transcriptional regulator [Secundilactobacillus oryzae JCM 18671]|uniref:XRE family transcriptional regulator n=1 Tax=Secundilactobacillus oryzae JCM 18671 TaxID=1291743 RepID=A0A081BIP6_9LACO|nr:RodZ domain-containing protein [Secundilactobacillus oryzae]GAK47914.1 XRE family transcriptional regulator [Secundilactobacillus oryzae JCM 18671]